jgi:hypothetical protein
MGDQIGQRYADLLLKITDTASFFDWKIPQEAQLEMWTRDKSGFAGVVKVDWEGKDSEGEENGSVPEEQSDEDLIASILGEIEQSGDIPEEAGELFSEYSPRIIVRAKDFAMLIHETIKGIYNLIISLSIPEDAEMAEDVIMNTDTLADELEDLRYGPIFAAKLRDFINEFPESDEIPNLREHVVGKMSLMESQEFLSFVLSFINGEPIARRKMQNLINSVKEDIGDYESALKQSEYGDDDVYREEDDEDSIPDEDGTIEAPEGYEEEFTSQETTDPALMTPSELEAAIDAALGARDFKEVERLSKYLKESRKFTGKLIKPRW